MPKANTTKKTEPEPATEETPTLIRRTRRPSPSVKDLREAVDNAIKKLDDAVWEFFGTEDVKAVLRHVQGARQVLLDGKSVDKPDETAQTEQQTSDGSTLDGNPDLF